MNGWQRKKDSRSRVPQKDDECKPGNQMKPSEAPSPCPPRPHNNLTLDHAWPHRTMTERSDGKSTIVCSRTATKSPTEATSTSGPQSGTEKNKRVQVLRMIGALSPSYSNSGTPIATHLVGANHCDQNNAGQ